MNALLPVLERNLSRRLSGREWQDDAVIDTTLDALIRIGANNLSFSLIEPLYTRRKAQALILMPKVKREPAFDMFLLKLTREKSSDGLGIEWFAAANLLLDRRVPGFAAAILEDMVIQGTITLCDPGEGCGRGGGRNTIADSASYIAPGFPPWPTYAIQKDSTARGVTGFLSGPVSLAYSRYVTREGSRPGFLGESRRQSPSSPSTAQRLQYLSAAFPNIPLTIRSDQARLSIAETQAALDAEAESLRSDIHNRYSELIQQLRDAGLLNSDEFTKLAVPKVTITLDDLRTVKTPLQNR
jgi:hypothetical protein